MSKHPRDVNDDVPRLEPWFIVAIASLVPITISLFLPVRLYWELGGLTFILLVVSMVMLRRQSRRQREAADWRES